MYQELRPMSLGQTSLERVLAMPGDGSIAGLSIASQNQALLDCANTLGALQSLAMAYRPQEEREQVPAKCQTMADRLADRSPNYSYAWYVGALASEKLGDWTGLNDRLAMSWRTGATEQWIGELRVALAENNYAQLGELMIRANDADLRMLVLSSRGVRTIAQRYVANPEFRERITVIVESMPPQNQARFVADVRRYANARKSGR